MIPDDKTVQEMLELGWRAATDEEQKLWLARLPIPNVHTVSRLVKGFGLMVLPTDEKIFIVCRQCGEAFDEIKIAYSHKPGECGSDQGFDLLPESEAM